MSAGHGATDDGYTLRYAATVEPTKDYVESLRLVNGMHAESFTFYRGKLESMGRDRMPVRM